MNNETALRQQLDAFRESRDLELPEMAELARALSRDTSVAAALDRSREFDRAVTERLTDVPVPVGLTERVLAAIDRENLKTASVSQPNVAPRAAWMRKHVRAILFSRAAWIGWATVAAALLLLTGGALYWRRSHQIFEQEQIASALGGWQKAANRNPSERGLPRDFVLPPLAVKPVRYVPFKTQEGWSAVAVDCTTSGGRPATLYIVQSSARFPSWTSPIPQFAASGKKVAAWREGRMLYVLVEEVARPRAGAGILHAVSLPA